VLFSSAAVAHGVVYVCSYDKNLYALNARTGIRLWSYATGNEIESSPSVVNGVVYVGSGDYKVYSFSLNHDLEQTGTAAKRPQLNTLRADSNLKVSKPITTP
jgi:outer membrane protein assembly factor BamB